MHYYNFNIADYRKDTTHLLPIEHYIYRTLIDWYYLDEQAIPKETQVVLRRLRLGCENEPNLNFVLEDFFKLQADGWHHLRIDAEIEAYHVLVEKNQANGKLGGRPRKTHPVTERLATDNPKESELNPNHKPITNNHKPITNIKNNTAEKDAGLDAFEDFWQIYPKKVGKADAKKAFAKLKAKAETLALITEALAWQVESEQWQKDGGQFIPNPSTYLNQARWLDQPVKAQRSVLSRAGQATREAAQRFMERGGE